MSRLYIISVIVSPSDLAGVFQKDKYPAFFGWISRMTANEAVKQSYRSPESHAAFIKTAKETGTHDYSHTDTTGKGVTIYARKQ